MNFLLSHGHVPNAPLVMKSGEKEEFRYSIRYMCGNIENYHTFYACIIICKTRERLEKKWFRRLSFPTDTRSGLPIKICNCYY